jgi:hypothetical protein
MVDPVIARVAAVARREAQMQLDVLLDDLCIRIGVDPWEVYRKPRSLERIDRMSTMISNTRRSAQAAQTGFRGGYLPLNRPRR